MDHHLRATQICGGPGTKKELEQPSEVTSESGRSMGTRAHMCKCVHARCDRYVPVTQGLCKVPGCWRSSLAPIESRLQAAWARGPFSAELGTVVEKGCACARACGMCVCVWYACV